MSLPIQARPGPDHLPAQIVLIPWKGKKVGGGVEKAGCHWGKCSVQERSCYRHRNIKETVEEFLLQRIVKFVTEGSTMLHCCLAVCPLRSLNNQAGVFRAASFTPPPIYEQHIGVEECPGLISHLVLAWTLILNSDLVVELPSFLGLLLLVTHQWHVTSCLALR